MTKHGKKYKAAKAKVDATKKHGLAEGLQKVKELAFAKFDESVDAHINIGIDPAKGEQSVRGSVLLPNSFGKAIRVIVFAKGDYAEKATKAGADLVGAEDLVDKIANGWMEFDYAVATPDLMGMVGKLAKQLGPKGLLPNKKVGTVTFEVAAIVSDLKKGRAFFKNDKNAIVHFSFGKVSQSVDSLKDNLTAFMKQLMAARPATAKGAFIKKVTIVSTMGVGVALSAEEIAKLN